MQGTTCKFTIGQWLNRNRDTNRFRLIIKFNHFIPMITPKIQILAWYNRVFYWIS